MQNRSLRRIAIFCGSSPGANPAYLKAAIDLGNCLVKNKIGLVYGGGNVGLMGAIASSVIDSGGEVIGVIPKALADQEVAYLDLPDLRIVDSMHSRKTLMADLADAFIALPGGMGTIEELMEILTWSQLGFHKKPCGILNISGFYDHLLEFLTRMVKDQFVDPEHQSMLLIDESPDGLLNQFLRYEPPLIDKAKRAKKLSGNRT